MAANRGADYDRATIIAHRREVLMLCRSARFFLLLPLLAAVPCAARDLYVHPTLGDERNDGLAAEADGAGHGPVKTIHRAVRYALPGDTVHLAKLDEPYHESPVFHDRICPADKPITLDGHGATITGAERMDLATWENVAPGRYRKVALLPRIDAAIVGRWFFRINGRMQHMGRTSKGPSLPLKKPEELQPEEWTFITDENAFYVQIEPTKSPGDYVIEAPMRSAGVQISGRNENIVIRNLNTQHVYNDGFNIHGYCRGVVFENVSAVECGDDGISAHDDCRIKVDGFTSIGNSTGFCHTNASHSDSNRVLIRDCLGFDVFVLDTGRHTLTNSLVFSSASSSVVVLGPRPDKEGKTPPGTCTLETENTAVVRRGKNTSLRWMRGAVVLMKNSAIVGFDLTVDADVLKLDDSVVGSLAERRNKLTVGAMTKATGAGSLVDVDLTGWPAGSTKPRPAILKFREPFDGSLVAPAEFTGGVDSAMLPKP
ncbi:MAG: right-handed parallel beta-helix repeat-containing protein [Planctomycetales bacterium]|nr:right-handed parallel beta-helix repeat-containing protein [Planctomycetales bacterium]